MANAGLTMNDATYARSKKGNAELFSNFKHHIYMLEMAVKDDAYERFKSTIKKNWVGADADDFLRDVEKTKKELLEKIDKLNNYFIQATGNDAKQFASFQAKNVK